MVYGINFVNLAFFPYMYVIGFVLICVMVVIGLHTSLIQYHLTNRLKTFFVIISLALILFAHYVLADNPSQSVYLRDTTILYAIWIMIAGLSGLSISAETIKKIEDQKIEIIEV